MFHKMVATLVTQVTYSSVNQTLELQSSARVSLKHWLLQKSKELWKEENGKNFHDACSSKLCFICYYVQLQKWSAGLSEFEYSAYSPKISLVSLSIIPTWAFEYCFLRHGSPPYFMKTCDWSASTLASNVIVGFLQCEKKFHTTTCIVIKNIFIIFCKVVNHRMITSYCASFFKAIFWKFSTLFW